MSKYTRGEFLGLGALLAGAGWAQAPTQPTGATAYAADLALLNGRIFTSDDTQPRAEALAVKNGRFVAVGSNADIKNIVTAQTQVIDAAGMTVTPGFIDCHCHPSGVQELYGVNTNLPAKAAIVAALRKRAAETQPGYWVTGFMYDDTKVRDGALTCAD